MSYGYYILDNKHRVIPVPGPDAWGNFFNDSTKRIVQQNRVAGFLLSTVFLGLYHSFGGGPPLIFETMLFTPDRTGSELYCARYTTWKQAQKGHLDVWNRLKRQRRGRGLAGKLTTARRILKEFGADDRLWTEVSRAIWAQP